MYILMLLAIFVSVSNWQLMKNLVKYKERERKEGYRTMKQITSNHLIKLITLEIFATLGIFTKVYNAKTILSNIKVVDTKMTENA